MVGRGRGGTLLPSLPPPSCLQRPSPGGKERGTLGFRLQKALSLWYNWGTNSGRGNECSVTEGMDWTSSLQTLPVGSLVFSVLATDPDTGSAGSVVYHIEEVSVDKSWGNMGPTASQDHQGAASPTQPAGTFAYWDEDRVLVLAQPWLPNLLLAPSGPHLPKLLKEGACHGQDPSSHPLAWATVWALAEFMIHRRGN